LTHKRSKYTKDDAVDVVWKVHTKSVGSFDTDSILKTSESSVSITMNTDFKSDETFTSENDSEESPNKDWAKFDSPKKPKSKKLLKRSNHTMCTVQVKYPAEEERLKKLGYKIIHFRSYVFGGLELESDGRFTTSNQLIEVRTR
jgi:hypothetical protein